MSWFDRAVANAGIEIKPPKEEPPEAGFLSNLAHTAYGTAQNLAGSALTALGANANARNSYMLDEIASNLEAEGNADLAAKVRNTPSQQINDYGNALINNGQYLANNAEQLHKQYGTRQEYEGRGLFDLLTDPQFLTDSRGLATSLTEGLVSSAPFIAASAIAPEVTVPSAVMRGARAIPFLGRAADWMLDRGVGSLLDRGISGAAMTTPADAMLNAAEIYKPLREQGYNDTQIAQRMGQAAYSEMPLDFANNVILSGLVTGKLSDVIAGKGAGRLRRGVGGATTGAIDMGGEGVQEVNQSQTVKEFSNRPHGVWYDPRTWDKEDITSFSMGAMGAGGPAVAGTVRDVIKTPNVDLSDIPTQDIEDKGLANTNNALKGRFRQLYDWANDKFGKQVEISGGARSEEHNRAVNGSPTSNHLHGNAMDVNVSMLTDAEREAFIQKAKELGFNSDGDDFYHDKGTGYHVHLSFKDNGDMSRFNDKQREAWQEAQWVQSQTGIPAEYIYRQWAHESGNFTSRLAQENNNFGGLTQVEPNGEENKQPDGGNYYRMYNNMHEYAQSYVNDFINRYKGRENIKSMADFVNFLHDNGYFTADPAEYLASMEGVDAPTGDMVGGTTTSTASSQQTPQVDTYDNVYEEFAKYKTETSTDADEVDLFSGFFNNKGKFVDNEETRQTIDELYGDELREFAESRNPQTVNAPRAQGGQAQAAQIETSAGNLDEARTAQAEPIQQGQPLSRVEPMGGAQAQPAFPIVQTPSQNAPQPAQQVEQAQPIEVPAQTVETPQSVQQPNQQEAPQQTSEPVRTARPVEPQPRSEYQQLTDSVAKLIDIDLAAGNNEAAQEKFNAIINHDTAAMQGFVDNARQQASDTLRKLETATGEIATGRHSKEARMAQGRAINQLLNTPEAKAMGLQESLPQDIGVRLKRGDRDAIQQAREVLQRSGMQLIGRQAAAPIEGRNDNGNQSTESAQAQAVQPTPAVNQNQNAESKQTQERPEVTQEPKRESKTAREFRRKAGRILDSYREDEITYEEAEKKLNNLARKASRGAKDATARQEVANALSEYKAQLDQIRQEKQGTTAQTTKPVEAPAQAEPAQRETLEETSRTASAPVQEAPQEAPKKKSKALSQFKKTVAEVVKDYKTGKVTYEEAFQTIVNQQVAAERVAPDDATVQSIRQVALDGIDQLNAIFAEQQGETPSQTAQEGAGEQGTTAQAEEPTQEEPTQQATIAGNQPVTTKEQMAAIPNTQEDFQRESEKRVLDYAQNAILPRLNKDSEEYNSLKRMIEDRDGAGIYENPAYQNEIENVVDRFAKQWKEAHGGPGPMFGSYFDQSEAEPASNEGGEKSAQNATVEENSTVANKEKLKKDYSSMSLDELKAERQKWIDEEVDRWKKNPGGQGTDNGYTYNDRGEINGRYGGSNNPDWYQWAYKRNGGKAPAKRDYPMFADEYLRNTQEYDELVNEIERREAEAKSKTELKQESSKTEPMQKTETKQEKPAEQQEEPSESIFGDQEENDREMLEALGITEDEADEEVSFGNEFGDTTDEEIEALKKELQKELSKLSANPMFNPRIYTLGLQLGGKYIQKGYRTFKKWLAKMTEDLGEPIEPWAPAIWETLKTYPKGQKFDPKQVMAVSKAIGSRYEKGMTSLEDIQADMKKLLKGNYKTFAPMVEASYNGIEKFFETRKESERNVDDRPGGLASRAGEGNNQDAVGRNDESGRPSRGSKREGRGQAKTDVQQQGGAGIYDSSTSSSGTAGNSRVQAEESQDRTNSAGSTELSGSVRDSYEGSMALDDGRKAEAIRPAEERPVNAANKEVKQNSVPYKAGDLDSIKADLPMLRPEQQEDVQRVEKRLVIDGGQGFLCTNGTGTGKTYSGLGVIKRAYDQGKKNILVVAPKAEIIKQWIEAAKTDFSLDIKQLSNTKDNGGEGICITTYANFQANRELAARDWDMIVADESHTLLENKDASETSALKMLRSLTEHPRQLYNRWKLKNRTKKIRALENKLDEYESKLAKLVADHNKHKVSDSVYGERSVSLQNNIKQTENAITEEYRSMNDQWKEVEKQWEAIPSENKPKVLFMSATPFAYDKSIDYAEGYLFNYNEDTNPGSYHNQSGFEQFMIQKFGYRFRYGKLAKPEAQVDNRVMEIQFHDDLVNAGVMYGRQIDLPVDYDRGFLLVDGGIGNKIDEGFKFLWDNDKKYGKLAEALRKQFDTRAKRYLIESIKAKAVVPIVQEYIKSGKKVVLFHQSMKEKLNVHPFQLKNFSDRQVTEQWELFKKERPDLVAMRFDDIPAPMTTLQSAFKDALYLDGSQEHKKSRNNAVKLFQDDDSGKNLIICQQDAANAGVSLHDTTGKHQRVLINIATPERPIYAMQIEGRIYRVGSVTNAIFRYLSTGTELEKSIFANTIGSRAETAENLALGADARGLRDSFTNLFMETLDDSWERRKPGHPEEGTGGKEMDFSGKSDVTLWERAKSFYYGQQKKTSSTKAQEGKDYFATPEPIGLKMVEWLGLKDGDSALEPSAGHGAISRWFSPNTNNTIVEPSGKLAPLAQMVTPNAKVIRTGFEDFNVVNKFDGIAMNPPFGAGGKTAVDHIAKAYKHLRNGGRMVAILPDGPSANAHFERWFYGLNKKGEQVENGVEDGVLMAEIELPGVTFDRAGTNVATKIVVIDKYTNEGRRQRAEANGGRKIELRDITDINELFDRMENLSLPEREKSAATTPAITESTSGLQEKYNAEIDGKRIFIHSNGLVTGYTYPVKDTIKKYGAKWDGSNKSWQINNPAKLAQFINDFNTDGATVPVPNAAEEGTFSTREKGGKFYATLNESQERETFKSLRTLAQKRGGDYERGEGFVFDNEEDMNDFIEVASDLLDMGEAKFSIAAWHGTPHDFDTFSLTGIGTGEGAQVHGWGLYFAKDRTVSEEYRKKLSDGNDADVIVDGKKISWSNLTEYDPNLGITEGEFAAAKYLYWSFGDVEKAIKRLNSNIEKKDKGGYSSLQVLQEARRYLSLGTVREPNKGSLLQVEIPDESEMLDEQRPINDQPAKYALHDILESALEENQLRRWAKNELPDSYKDSMSRDETVKLLWDSMKVKNGGEDFYKGLARWAMETDGKANPKAASELLNTYGIPGITYEGGIDGRCYVVFDDNAIDIIAKFSKGKGKINNLLKNISFAGELTSQEQEIVNFGKELGVRVEWFSGPANLHGFHQGNTTFINRNSKMDVTKVFYHEAFHWIKSNNPAFYEQLVDNIEKAGIFTQEQIDGYRERTGRNDLSDRDVIEEMLADEFINPASRHDVLGKLARQNKGIVEKLIAWMKQIVDRIAEVFHNPQGKLTTAQRNAFVESFGKMAASLRDKNGNLIFKTENNGREIKLTAGENVTRFAPVAEVKFSADLGESEKSFLDRAAERFGLKVGNDRIKVKSNKPSSGVGLLGYYLGSPSRIAEKVKSFRPFYRMADKAMNLLTKNRSDFQRKFDKAWELCKKQEDRDKLNELLIAGDAEEHEYTKEEILAEGGSENVAKAYEALRRLTRKAYNLVNEAHKRPTPHSRRLTEDEIKKLRENKFVQIQRITDAEDGRKLVTYKEFANWEKEYDLTPEELARFENDNAIQILERSKNEDGTTHVKVREGKGDLNNKKGYIPHIFHEYMVRVKDKDGNVVEDYGYGGVLTSGRNERDAIKKAEEWLKANKLKDGETIVIAPKVYSFNQLGMDESQYAAVLGDKDYDQMMKGIADTNEMTLKEAKEIVGGNARKKARHRFFGHTLQRKGAKGFEEDMQWGLRHYFNGACRYHALETEFKPQAISLFERLHGDFSKKHSGIAKYTQDFINDINGNPSELENQINDALNRIPAWRRLVVANFGDRAALRAANSVTGLMSHLCLGYLNVSSALLNFSQAINACAYLGNAKFAPMIIARGGKRKFTPKEIKVLIETNVGNDIGLDSGSGYDKVRSAGGLLNTIGNKGMILFKKSEQTMRFGTTLVAYDKAIADGKSHDEAIVYAKDINKKSNFDYSVADAPNIFRRGSVISQIALQFKKYGMKEMEVVADMFPGNSKTTAKQKALFWSMYLLTVGLLQAPLGDWWDKLIGESLYGGKYAVQKALMEAAGDSPVGKFLAKTAMYGLPASTLNIDMSKRAGLGDVFPTELKDFTGPAPSKIYSFIQDVLQGNKAAAIRDVSPGVYNQYAAWVAGHSEGSRGRTNATYDDAYSKILRSMGFTSTDERIAQDIQQITYKERDKLKLEKQKAIDDFIENPTGENGRRLKELGIKPSTVKKERERKKRDRLGRIKVDMSKKDQRNRNDIFDFAEDE